MGERITVQHWKNLGIYTRLTVLEIGFNRRQALIELLSSTKSKSVCALIASPM